MNIQEGNLLFTFPDDWEVTQYDEWQFYRTQFQNCCQSGHKAVDFVAVFPTSGKKDVWFIEVKDYRQHRRTKVIDLPFEVALKVRDSLAGIAAARFNAYNAQEKEFAERIMRASRLRVVLHLEQPQKHSKLFPRSIDPSKLLQKLKSLIRPIDAHPMIVEKANCENQTGWTVSSVKPAAKK